MHSTYEARLATFEGRQDLFPVAIQKLAAAGFCWTPFRESPSAVRCEDCELIHKSWADIPSDLLNMHPAACPFRCASSATTSEKSMLIDFGSTGPKQAPVVPSTYISAAHRDLMAVFQDSLVTVSTPSTKHEPVKKEAIKQNTPEPDEIEDSRLPSELPKERSLPAELKTCKRCDTLFPNRDLLFQHVYTNCGKNPERCPNPFPCRICKDSFKMKHQLKSHLKIAHDIALWY